MKLNNILIWHEFGHVFGFVLINVLYNDYRKIEEFFLIDGCSNPYIAPRRDKLFDEEITDISGSIMIFIMGAVFHVTRFRKDGDISLRDFKEIFINVVVGYPLSISYLRGYAGSDFTKIKAGLMDFMLYDDDCILSKYDFCSIKEFSFELQKILKRHGMFELLTPFIERFNEKYNGKRTIKCDLYKSQRVAIESIIKIDLVHDINCLVNKFYTVNSGRPRCR